MPEKAHLEFESNYKKITKGTNRLFLFAGDQKIEHLNPINPEIFFSLASQIPCGAFATHLGLIEQYGSDYTQVNYIAKLNGKTNLVPTEQQDPLSKQLWSVADVMRLKKEKRLNICGVGYTIYLGSEYESTMLHEAAQIVQEAHQNGLVVILWIYLRGKAVLEERNPKLIAGAAGVAATLGADFIKIKSPEETVEISTAQGLQNAGASAGKTKVLCAGGTKQDAKVFVRELHEQLTQGKTAGAAIGRNIYQQSLEQAIQLARAIAGLVYENYSLEQALRVLE